MINYSIFQLPRGHRTTHVLRHLVEPMLSVRTGLELLPAHVCLVSREIHTLVVEENASRTRIVPQHWRVLGSNVLTHAVALVDQVQNAKLPTTYRFAPAPLDSLVTHSSAVVKMIPYVSWSGAIIL